MIANIYEVRGTRLFDDTLIGDQRANYLYSHGGNDRLEGRGGNDILSLEAGVGVADGGRGNDLLVLGSNFEGGTLQADGGPGVDWLTAYCCAGIIVDLERRTISHGYLTGVLTASRMWKRG